MNQPNLPLFFSLVACVLGCGSIPSTLLGQTNATANPAAIDAELKQVIENYAKLFHERDAGTLAQEYYSAPVLLIEPEKGMHRVLETTVGVEQQIEATLSQIESSGWDHSMIHSQDIKMAGVDMAILSIVFSRCSSDGSAIAPGRLRGTFLLLKKRDGWRIIMACTEPFTETIDEQATHDKLSSKMDRYIELLNGPKPAEGVTKEIYQFPRLSRSFLGDRKQKAMLSESEVLVGLKSYLNELKAKGMTEIRVHSMKVHSVSNHLAFVELISSRVLADGTPIPPADTPFTYIWVKKPTGWKMISTLAHGSAE